MNKIKNYHLTFMIAICSILITIFIGCGDFYDEGDENARHRFEKMTSQEKALYNSVQEVWGQRDLKTIREAVSRRETRPPENSLAFNDIASVIKTNNIASLKLDSGWETSTKNKHILARWDRVDEGWYRKLLLSIGEKQIIKQELIPEEKVIKEEVEEENFIPRTQLFKTVKIDSVKIDSNDIIPSEKYDDLYFEIKKCPEAVLQYKQIVENRILTWADYDLLIRISLKCKANVTLEKMEM